MPDLGAFSAGGEMGALIRGRDWTHSALGAMDDWPQSLRSALGIVLRSTSPSALFWGEQHIFLYNDAWADMLGARHPAALGCPASEVWPEAWRALEPRFRAAFEQAETVNHAGVRLLREREGRPAETYWAYSLLPIGDEQGRVGGLLGQASETTQAVARVRHEALLHRLSEALRGIEEPGALIRAALTLLNEGLKADRLGFSEVEEADESVTILASVQQPGMKDLSGPFPRLPLGPALEDELRAGQAIRIDDVLSDPRIAGPAIRDWCKETGVAAVAIVPIAGGARYRAALFAHQSQPRAWSDSDAAILRAATELIWREIARARAQTALRHSEERYRRLFEQANDIILTADLDQIVTDCNPAGAAAMGLDREEIIGRSIAEFVTPAGFDQTSRMLGLKLEKGGTTRHEIDVVLPTGTRLHWEINSSLAIDSEGKVVGLHAIARDVTERRRQEERQGLLVNELNHRVKNTLSLVQGLALQTFKDGRDMSEAREVFQQRLAALAVAHDLLTRESWEGATLAELVEEAVGHHNGGGERIGWSGPAIRVNPKAAVSLVMALHELSTNAAKYGGLSVTGGRVAIEWEEQGDRLILSWREQGGPRVHAPVQRGFGLRMIERALASDLSGRAQIAFEPDGLVARIDAPLDQIAPKRETA
jgi:PAS domain S-box-containing protein